MKLLKLTLCSLLLIVSSCSSEKEDPRWRNDLVNQTINGVKNPYMVDDFIYIYSASDKYAMEHDMFPYDACTFRMYSLNDNVTSVRNVKKYLNSLINTKTETDISNVYIKGQDFYSIWMKQKEITSSFFNPFVKMKHSNIQYERYQSCKKFLLDSKSDYKKYFLKKYSLKFIEESNFSDKKYNLQEFRRIIENPNTLTRINIWCRVNFIDYIDLEEKLFIRLQYSIDSTTSPNPVCH